MKVGVRFAILSPSWSNPGVGGVEPVPQSAVSNCHSVVVKFHIKSVGTAPHPIKIALAHVPLTGSNWL